MTVVLYVVVAALYLALAVHWPTPTKSQEPPGHSREEAPNGSQRKEG